MMKRIYIWHMFYITKMGCSVRTVYYSAERGSKNTKVLLMFHLRNVLFSGLWRIDRGVTTMLIGFFGSISVWFCFKSFSSIRLSAALRCSHLLFLFYEFYILSTMITILYSQLIDRSRNYKTYQFLRNRFCVCFEQQRGFCFFGLPSGVLFQCWLGSCCYIKALSSHSPGGDDHHQKKYT